MHYKNGREAKVGDKVIRLNAGKPDLLGILVEANPGSKTCNGQIVALPTVNHYATLSDCLHADDAIVKDAPAT